MGHIQRHHPANNVTCKQKLSLSIVGFGLRCMRSRGTCLPFIMKCASSGKYFSRKKTVSIQWKIYAIKMIGEKMQSIVAINVVISSKQKRQLEKVSCARYTVK